MIYKGMAAVLSCCCGMLAAETFSVFAGAWAAGVIVSAAGAVLFRRHHQVMAVMIVICFFCIGGGRMQAASDQYESLPHYISGADIYIEGTIEERGKTYMSEQGEMTRYVLSLDQYAYAGETAMHPGGGAVYITVPAYPQWQPSSRIAYEGKVKPIRYYRNRGVYDAARRDKEKSVFLKSYNEKAGCVTLLEEPKGVFYRIGQVREGLTNMFQLVLSEDDAYILSSLVFGGHYDELAPELLESFSATGLIHILSVSGSHIALLVAVVQCISRFIGLRQKGAFAATAVFIVIYGALAEFTAPVVRASVMGLISAYSVVARREYVGIQALAVAVFGMIMYSPYILYDLSFRLSCGASAGIILFQQPVRQRLAILPDTAADSLAVCISAQLLMVPLLFAYFFSFPVYTFFANLLIAPILDIIIILGVVASACAYIAEPVMRAVLLVIEPLLALAVKGNYFLAALPHSRYWAGAMPFPVAAAWYLAVAAVFFLPSMRRFLLSLAVFLCIGTAAWSYWHKADVVVHVFDAGADKATCAVYDDGSVYLWYNKSPWSSPEQVLYVLTPALRYEGIFRLTGCTISGEESNAAAEQLALQFVIDEPFRAGTGQSDRCVVAGGAVPYYLYDEIPQHVSDEYACFEVRRPGGSHFPAGAAALIVHKDSAFDQAYGEWMEGADLYDIYCFSPERDGQITGEYRNGTWTFFTYGGK